MANTPARKSSTAVATKGRLGPKLIVVGLGLFALAWIVDWLPLGLIDGPILALLWLGAIASVVAGAGLMFLNAKRS